jgi:thiamine biosynthesis lipoprotein
MIENSFSRMGTTVKVLLPAGDEAMLDFVQARSWNLEALWSRFIGTSDIAMLALAEGQAVQVATETIELVEQMLQAHFATEGFFDPTLMAALNEAGYSKSRVSNDISVLPVAGGSSALSDVRIDHNTNEITLPAGMSLDPGGIGKGMAADMIVRDLVEMGVQGASVSMGGDAALAGTPDDGDNWVVNIGAPDDYSKIITTIRCRGGGVATSTLAARTWNVDGEKRHHVIDPRTRKPAEISEQSTLQASVIAGSAMWAETFATAFTVCDAHKAEQLAARHNLSALLVLHNGTLIELGNWSTFAQ